MKKRTLLMAVLATSVAFGSMFTACSDSGDQNKNAYTEAAGATGITCSETYQGKLSETSYDTADAAISGYVKEEIGNFTVMESSKVKSLTAAEIEALPLTSEQKNGVTGADEYSVTYYVAAGVSSVGYFASSSAGQTATHKVYLLVINGKVFYLDPLPDTGNDLSKSYYDSVLSYDNYTNCTITETTTSVSSSSQYGVTATSTVTVTTSIKIDNGKCLYAVTASVEVSPGDYSNSQSVYYYFEETENGFSTYTSDNGTDWQNYYGGLSLADGTVVSSLSDLIIICQYDYSYLTKTSTGFTIKDEYYSDYLENALSSVGSDVEVKNSGLYYYVSDGKVVKAYSRIDATATVQGVKCSVQANADAYVTDFGTTTVSVSLNGSAGL